jgi:hypothetical protein
MCHSKLKETHLFLDISSTNTDTLVLSLYQCIETRSIEVFCQTLPHPTGNYLRLSNVLREFLDSAVKRYT